MAVVSIVLPTYNEKDAIVANVRHIISSVKKTKWDYEILVVDDDSPDMTANVVREAFKNNKRVRVIVRQDNHGLGLSIGCGVDAARGEVIIGMDADGNHDPSDLRALLAEIEKGTKLVVASRFVETGGMKGWRMIPTFLFNATFRLFGLPIWDNTSGYYAIRKRDLVKIGLKKIYYGYGDYHLRLVYAAKQLGYSIIEVPTNYQPRIGGTSKSRLLNMAIDYLKVAWKLRVKGLS